MAALRAVTMATTIQKTWRAVTPCPRAARATAVRAKGRAKTEWEKRIMRP